MFKSKREKNHPQTTRQPRIPTFRFATICDENGTPLVDATVREISSGGAQLRVKSARKLPDRLVIRSEPDQSCMPAELKWRTGASIGVEFDQKIELTEKQPDRENRVRVICSHLTHRS